MGLRCYDFDSGRQVVIVDNEVDLPLSVPTFSFGGDIDEAYAWLTWLRPRDARCLDADELSRAIDAWVAAGKPGVEP